MLVRIDNKKNFLFESSETQGDNLKEWEYVQVGHHNYVGETIERMERDGWGLHTYTCSQWDSAEIRHYLLFEREK